MNKKHPDSSGCFCMQLEVKLGCQLAQNRQFFLLALNGIDDADDLKHKQSDTDDGVDEEVKQSEVHVSEYRGDEPVSDRGDDDRQTLFEVEFNERVILRHQKRDDDENPKVGQYRHQGMVV